MQITIHVICKKQLSLRDAILEDGKNGRLDEYDLWVKAAKSNFRPHGWTKVLGKGIDGALNINYVANAKTLVARVITKGGKPGPLFGKFLQYLWERHRRDIKGILIDPE